MKSRMVWYKPQSTIIKCCPFCKTNFVPSACEYERGKFNGALFDYYCNPCFFSYAEYHDPSKVNKLIDVIELCIDNRKYMINQYYEKDNKNRWLICSTYNYNTTYYNVKSQLFGYFDESEFIVLLNSPEFKIMIQNMEIMS